MALPHIHEIENKLLDTYIKHPDLFEKLEHLVTERIFTRSVSKDAYKVITALHSQGTTPDPAIIYSELKKLKHPQADCVIITGANYDYSYVTQTEKYVDILFKHSVANYLMPILADTHQKLLSETGDSLELMDSIGEAINRVNLVVNNAQADKSIYDVFDEAVQRINDLKNNVLQGTGFSFGLKELDEKTGGLQKGVTVIGATPGSGKTSLVINIITNNAILNQVPTIFFSVEMPAIEIMTNIISNVTEINSRALRQGDVDDGNLLSIGEIRKRLNENFVIDDRGGITWQYIEVKVKAFRKKHKIPANQTILCVIDYLQLMDNTPEEKKGTTDERQIEIRCKEVTRMSKNDNVASVLLSQLTREVTKRNNPRPVMSDLKGSGAIEACAILILLLFRPDYVGIYTDDKGRDLRGLCEINPVKGRYIKPEPVYVKFEGKYSKFSDYVSPENAIQQGNPTF